MLSLIRAVLNRIIIGGTRIPSKDLLVEGKTSRDLGCIRFRVEGCELSRREWLRI